MDLEPRVTALEDDVAVLRMETRGWAAIAVSANGKASMAGEMLTNIYEEVRQLRATVAQHGETLDRHTGMLREILRRLPAPG